MKPKVNPIVLVSVLVIIVLAAFVLGWRHFFPAPPLVGPHGDTHLRATAGGL